MASLRFMLPKVLPATWQIMANDDQRYRDTPPALLHVMIAVLAVVQFGFVQRIFETFLKG